MEGASKKLSDILATIEIKKPVVPIVNNANAVFLNEVPEIKASLIRQLSNPLLWEDSIKKIEESGTGIFIEVGPGKVLSGLIKRIVPGAVIFNVEDAKSLEYTLSGIG